MTLIEKIPRCLLAALALIVATKFIGSTLLAQDDPDAVHKAAEQGNAKAQFKLGQAYYSSGSGVPQDDVAGARWYRLAAEQGHIKAQIALGAAYALGRGVLKDYVKSTHWYRLAAEQGDADAQLLLGIAYTEGRDLLKDYLVAHMWLNIANANGLRSAGQIRDNIESLYMTHNDILRATEMARMCIVSDYQSCQP